MLYYKIYEKNKEYIIGVVFNLLSFNIILHFRFKAKGRMIWFFFYVSIWTATLFG